MITKLISYAWRNIFRKKSRSIVTLTGIAIAMFLFSFIEGIQNGVSSVMENETLNRSLIVYQKSRFCPSTSNLPERYEQLIRKIPGVIDVTPTKIYVNNCRTSLDSVTFRGVPVSYINSENSDLEIISGSKDNFENTASNALIGKNLAKRRNLKPGDTFKIGDVSVIVAGIFASDIPGEDNLAYTNLNFLQQARGVNSIGKVTQFDVKLDKSDNADSIVKEIDNLFRSDEIPTNTKTHKAFINSATGDLIGLIRFSKWLGILSVVVVLALTANTIYVLMQDRIKEHAVLQTLGFSGQHLFFMVIFESLLLALVGGIIGIVAAAYFLSTSALNLSTEGVQIPFTLNYHVIIAGLSASIATGVLAGLIPAIQSAFLPIVSSLRKTT